LLSAKLKLIPRSLYSSSATVHSLCARVSLPVQWLLSLSCWQSCMQPAVSVLFFLSLSSHASTGQHCVAVLYVLASLCDMFILASLSVSSSFIHPFIALCLSALFVVVAVCRARSDRRVPVCLVVRDCACAADQLQLLLLGPIVYRYLVSSLRRCALSQLLCCVHSAVRVTPSFCPILLLRPSDLLRFCFRQNHTCKES